MFTNGENLTAKTPQSDFRSPLPKLHYYYNKRLQVKEFQVPLPTYSWTLTTIPNWICSVVTVPLSDARFPSTWLTNYADPSTRLQTPTKKIVGCKVLQFIHTMKIKKMLGHKTLRCKYTATSSRERDELGQELRLRSQFAWTEFSQYLCNLYTFWRLLKQSFYMYKVRRKEDPKTYSRISRKSYLNSEILEPRQIGGVEQLSKSYRALMNLHSLLDFLIRLEGFNTWS